MDRDLGHEGVSPFTRCRDLVATPNLASRAGGAGRSSSEGTVRVARLPASESGGLALDLWTGACSTGPRRHSRGVVGRGLVEVLCDRASPIRDV